MVFPSPESEIKQGVSAQTLYNKRQSLTGQQITSEREFYPSATLTCGSNCTSITFESNTVKNFNLKKAAITKLNQVAPNQGTRIHGVIFTLSTYDGPILIKSNTFQTNQFQFGNCEIGNGYASVSTDTEAKLIISDNTQVQVKTLIYIRQGKGQVVLVSNQFLNNNAMHGVVFISKQEISPTPVLLIHSNTFKQNQGFIGASALRVDVETATTHTTTTSLTQVPCTGVKLSGNTFEQNTACPVNSQSVVEVNCLLGSTMQTAVRDDQKAYSVSESTAYPSNTYSNTHQFMANVQGLRATVDSKTVEGQSVDVNKFEMSGNTFTENYLGNKGAVVTAKYFPFISMSGETYQKNTNSFTEAITKYGSITPRPNANNIGAELRGAVYFKDFYDTTKNIALSASVRSNLVPIGIISLYGILNSQIGSNQAQNMKFINNYFIEPKFSTSYKHSNGIILQKCMGEQNLQGLRFQDLTGLDLTFIKTTYSLTNLEKLSINQILSTTGAPITALAAGTFQTDYGIKGPLIQLYQQGTDPQNTISKLNMDYLNIINVEQFDTDSPCNMVGTINDQVAELTIGNILINGSDCYACTRPALLVKIKGAFTMTSGTVEAYSKRAFELTTTTDATKQHLSKVGFLSIMSNTHSSRTNTITSLTFKGNKALQGSCVILDQGEATSQDIAITIDQTTFDSNIAHDAASIYLNSAQTSLTITKTTFQMNKVTKESGSTDIYAKIAKLCMIDNCTFTQFDFEGATKKASQSMKITSKPSGGITIKNTIFECVTQVQYTRGRIETNRIKDLSANGYALGQAIYIDDGKVTSMTNHYRYCNRAAKGGQVYIKNHGEFIDTGSQFYHNSANQGGAVVILAASIGKFTNSKFYKNLAKDGGALALESSSQSVGNTNVTFEYNQALSQGGAIIVQSLSTIEFITNTTFNLNKADTGAAIYMMGTSNQNKFIDNKFIRNTALGIGAIQILFSNVLIKDSTLDNNEAAAVTKGLFISFSTVEVTNTFFDFSTTRQKFRSLTGCHMTISSNSSVHVNNDTFKKGQADSGGAIYLSGQSDLYIEESKFNDMKANQQGGAVYIQNYKSVTVKNTQFTNNEALMGGGSIYSSSGQLNVINCVFNSKFVPSVIYLVGSTFLGEKVNIISIHTASDTAYQAPHGAGIYGQSSVYFELKDSLIKDFSNGVEGSAITLIRILNSQSVQTIPGSPTHKLENVTMKNNTGEIGGAMFVKDIDYLQIKDTVFEGNVAKNDTTLSESGKGAGVYFSSTKTYTKVEFVGSNFTSNNAHSSGGAVFWNYMEPTNLANQIYQSNKATLYGDNYGCFAQNLQSINADRYKSVTGKTYRSLSIVGTSEISLTNFQSGSALPTIYIGILDKFGQIVGSDTTSSTTLNIRDTSGTYTPVLVGETTQKPINGVLKFALINFTAEPGGDYSLYFSTNAIDTTKPSNKAYLSSTNKADTNMKFLISLRSCNVGEAFQLTGKCLRCEGPDYYSLALFETVGDCKLCPKSKAICRGGADIGPLPKFWRSSNTTDNFLKCLYPAACLGMIKPTYNPIGECFEGYQSYLCADCKINFSRTSDFRCGKCPSHWWNAIRLLLVLLGMLVAIVYLIISTLQSALRVKNLQSVYIKIFTNHITLITLTASFNFDWPKLVTQLFEVTTPIAKVSQQFISFDCFLDSRKNVGDNQKVMRLYYQKMMMYAILPILMVVLAVILWIPYFIVKRKDPKLNGEKMPRIIASIIVLLFLIHPNIVQYMFDSYYCVKIDNVRRVQKDLEVICWKGSHLQWGLVIAAPSIIVWGLGIPAFAWLILSRNKNNLKNLVTRQKYGFLYNGYRTKYYYWESIIIYRKIFVIFISVFLGVAGVITQALSVFLMLIIFLILTLKVRPFQFNSLNSLETVSICSSLLTVYCGMFFLSDQPHVYNSSDSKVREDDLGLRLDEGAKMFFFIVIVIANAIFVFSFIYRMYQEVAIKIRTGMSKVSVVICYRGNQDKFDVAVKKKDEIDQNDILIEEFDSMIEDLQHAQQSGYFLLNEDKIETVRKFLAPEYIKDVLDHTKHVQTDGINKSEASTQYSKRHLDLPEFIRSQGPTRKPFPDREFSFQGSQNYDTNRPLMIPEFESANSPRSISIGEEYLNSHVDDEGLNLNSIQVSIEESKKDSSKEGEGSSHDGSDKGKVEIFRMVDGEAQCDPPSTGRSLKDMTLRLQQYICTEQSLPSVSNEMDTPSPTTINHHTAGVQVVQDEGVEGEETEGSGQDSQMVIEDDINSGIGEQMVVDQSMFINNRQNQLETNDNLFEFKTTEDNYTSPGRFREETKQSSLQPFPTKYQVKKDITQKKRSDTKANIIEKLL